MTRCYFRLTFLAPLHPHVIAQRHWPSQRKLASRIPGKQVPRKQRKRGNSSKRSVDAGREEASVDARRAWMQWVMRFVRDNAASRERQGSMKGASRKPQGNRLEARGDEASSLEISRARVATHAGDGPRVRQHEAEVAVSSSADCLCLTLAAPSSLRLSLSSHEPQLRADRQDLRAAVLRHV